MATPDLPSGRELFAPVSAKWGELKTKSVGNYFGKSGLFLESFGQLHTDIYGLSTATAAWVSPIDQMLWPDILSPHPIWTFLHMERRTVSVEYGFVRTIGEYAGFELHPVPVVEYSTGVNEEPIQTHPNFADFAGTPSAPQNGAIFINPATGELSTDDGTGVFQEFWSNPPNDFAGQTTYLMPVLVMRTTTIDSSPTASTGQVGHLQGGMLCTNVTVSQRGIVFQTTVELRGGGPRGWNSQIYN
jgi:hypothetical protein